MTRLIPGRRRNRRVLDLVLLGVLLGGLAACDDKTIAVDTIEVRLVDSRDDSPVFDAEVGLFDLVEWRMVRNQRVDRHGTARLRPPVPGVYAPVIQAEGFQVFALPRSRVEVGHAGRRFELTIPLRPTAGLTDFGVRLSGRVVDAVTGRPVVHAQIEMTSAEVPDANFSELRGDRSAAEVVSDQEGLFVIPRVPLLQVPGQPEPFTTSLRVRARGFRSTYLRGWSRSDVPSSVDISLERGQDDGRITGRVVDLDGLPLTGVSVRAEWRSGNLALFRDAAPPAPWSRVVDPPHGLALPNTDHSDSDGRFTLTGLPRGRFHLRAAVDDDDGFWSDAGRNVVLEDTSATVDAGDLLAMPALELAGPNAGAVVDSSGVLSWRPYPGAAEYLVSVRRGDGAFFGPRTDSPALALSIAGDFVRPGAWYAWRVFAVDAAGRLLSSSAEPRLLRVE